MRGLFSATEIDEIRGTFMEMAKDGRVPGLSDVPKARDGAPASGNDLLARYQRMMHTHQATPPVTLPLRSMLEQLPALGVRSHSDETGDPGLVGSGAVWHDLTS